MRRYGRRDGADNDKQQKQDGGWSLLTPRSFAQTTLMKNQPGWNRNGREKRRCDMESITIRVLKVVTLIGHKHRPPTMDHLKCAFAAWLVYFFFFFFSLSFFFFFFYNLCLSFCLRFVLKHFTLFLLCSWHRMEKWMESFCIKIFGGLILYCHFYGKSSM